MNASGFLEVVGNAMNVDLIGYREDMEKLFKGLQFSDILASKNFVVAVILVVICRYQFFNNLERILVYLCTVCNITFVWQLFNVFCFINLERETTIYTMHCVKGGLYVVDIITNFTIPDNKDQVYVIDKILEKVYFFKV